MGAPTSRASREDGTNNVSRQAEAGQAPSSAGPTGAGLSKDGPVPRRTRAHRCSGFRLRKTVSRRACGVGAAQVARSVIERCSSARYVSRLQKSVRSIFFVSSRGAERQTEAMRDSASRRHGLDEDASNESGDKGARGLART